MNNLSSLDLQYYSQVIGCAIGDFGYKTANNMLYGRKCANSNITSLKLAIALQKIVKKYIPIGIERIATRTITILTEGTSLKLSINNGYSLSTNFDTTIYQTALDMQSNINITASGGTYISEVIALGDPSVSTTPVQIVFSAPIGLGFSGNSIQVALSSINGFTFNINGFSYLQGGLDPLEDYDNCVTEEQMQGSILPTLSKILNIQLPLPGIIVNSIPPTASINNARITENGGTRQTESGDTRIIE